MGSVRTDPKHIQIHTKLYINQNQSSILAQALLEILDSHAPFMRRVWKSWLLSTNFSLPWRLRILCRFIHIHMFGTTCSHAASSFRAAPHGSLLNACQDSPVCRAGANAATCLLLASTALLAGAAAGSEFHWLAHCAAIPQLALTTSVSLRLELRLYEVAREVHWVALVAGTWDWHVFQVRWVAFAAASREGCESRVHWVALAAAECARPAYHASRVAIDLDTWLSYESPVRWVALAAAVSDWNDELQQGAFAAAAWHRHHCKFIWDASAAAARDWHKLQVWWVAHAAANKDWREPDVHRSALATASWILHWRGSWWCRRAIADRYQADPSSDIWPSSFLESEKGAACSRQFAPWHWQRALWWSWSGPGLPCLEDDCRPILTSWHWLSSWVGFASE